MSEHNGRATIIWWLVGIIQAGFALWAIWVGNNVIAMRSSLDKLDESVNGKSGIERRVSVLEASRQNWIDGAVERSQRRR